MKLRQSDDCRREFGYFDAQSLVERRYEQDCTFFGLPSFLFWANAHAASSCLAGKPKKAHSCPSN
jgi:hypothetical protein